MANLLRDRKPPSTDAREYYDRALKIQEKANGLEHVNVAIVLEQYAKYLNLAKDKAKAAELEERAAKIRGKQ